MGFLTANEVDVKEMLGNMFRVGVVDSIDSKKCTARVIFPDDEEVVSYDLQVLHTNTYKNKDYNMPDIGEDVLCLFLSTGMAEGFILGSVYAGDVEPPHYTENKRMVTFDDGTKVAYDREFHTVMLEIEGTKITANRKKITINTPLEIEVSSSYATVNANKTNIKGVLGTTSGATGVITGLSVATVVNGIVTGIS